ncbi:ribonuclease D [Spirulina major]|uniref:ribonuclease D n=1 Tax=Spirulina major TaxID=270636 RepID=UPI0009341E10|nr:ribonuclease H-like domain-containing protein [Spirulina major]
MNKFHVCDRDLDTASFEHYQQAEALALDTETMGLVLGRDRLCLVQLCDPDGYITAIRIAPGQTAAPNLSRLLENPQITKIFHYARFDVAQFQHTFNTVTQPIFCTKIASKIARTYTGSHGLKSLVQELEGIELDKSSQSSDWGNPHTLSPDQLQYAANDVRYLIPLRQKLITMLERENRWVLAQRCFDCLPVIIDLDILQFKDIFDHK